MSEMAKRGLAPIAAAAGAAVVGIERFTGSDRLANGPHTNLAPGRRPNYYVRQFPQTISHLLDSLTPDEFVAVARLHRERALRDEPLPAADQLLGTITKMTDKAWVALRDKLLALGLAHVENGMWIDEDQERSLEIQRNSRRRGQRGAQARWAVTRD